MICGHLDFETRSRVDLKAVGAWAYAAHPSTEIMCASYAPHGGAVQVFTAAELRAKPCFPADGIISAHNAAFEYAVYNLILHRRHGWPARWDPSLWSCTMARAAACGLPLDLDSLGRVLQVPVPKDLEGRRVMQQLCKPGADGKFDEDPAKYEKLRAYNKTDVLVEMAVDERLPRLSAAEQKVWELDLVMNRRGIRIDLDLARRAAPLAEALVDDLNTRLRVLTRGEVDKATQLAAMKTYLVRQGVRIPERITVDGPKTSLDAEAVTAILEDPDLAPDLREVLSVRVQVGKKNSVAKFTAALEMTGPDGRARGLLQYHAAHTGRWGGRLLQPQNFPKGLKQAEQLAAIALVSDPAMFSAVYGSKSMETLSGILRGLFVAAPGKTFLRADFNAIEARVLFWLAGEKGALAAYARGESPYFEMAEYIYKQKVASKESLEYDIGKRTVLGAGYGMGPDKFVSNIYTETAKKGKGVRISPELGQRAIKGYREKYAAVPRLWKEIEAAAVNAALNPGKTYPCAGGRVLWGMTQDRRFLAARLPSGRYLRYWRPEVIDSYRIFCKDKDCPHWKAFDEAKCPTYKRVKVLTYWGEHLKTHEWCQIPTYGGALTENVDSAIARDIMVNGMQTVEAAGYEMLLTIHDELLAEREAAKANLEDFIARMCALPAWAAGLPIKAEGWAGQRYRK